MLPLNSYRLFQMMRLVRGVKILALPEDLNMDWLKPFMTKRLCRKGDVLFAKDAVADEMYYTMSGRYRLTEMGIDIPPGQIIGELGMLAPSNRRTASFECIEDGMLLTVTYQQVKELYFQNPESGFDFPAACDRAAVRQYRAAAEPGRAVAAGKGVRWRRRMG